VKNFEVIKLLRLSLIPHMVLFLLGCILSLQFLGIMSTEDWLSYFIIVLGFKVYLVIFIDLKSKRVKTYRMNKDKYLKNLTKVVSAIPIFLIFLMGLNLILKSYLIKEWIFPSIITLEIIYNFYTVKVFRRKAFFNIYL
jgi:hypothetical protein